MTATPASFKRKAYDEILEWKRTLAGKTALLVEGARRVGKTHLVKRFAENEYESYVFIDFSEKGSRTRAFKRAFEECDGTADLLERLQLAAEVSLVPGRSCVVFDEVQRYPAAREAIKQLVAYGKYHYIETGSERRALRQAPPARFRGIPLGDRESETGRTRPLVPGGKETARPRHAREGEGARTPAYGRGRHAAVRRSVSRRRGPPS